MTKSQLGENFLDKCIKHLPDYEVKSSTEQESLKKGAIDAIMAILFLRNSNQGEYGELAVHDYRKKFANSEDQYTKTLRQVVDVMQQIKPKRKKKSYDEFNKKQNNHINKKHPNRR